MATSEKVLDDFEDGHRQSPVVIPAHKLEKLAVPEEMKYVEKTPIEIQYPELKQVTLKNCSFGWKVELDPHNANDWMQMEKTLLTGGPLEQRKYLLKEFHARWCDSDNFGSEHRIKTSKDIVTDFSGELQFTHYINDPKVGQNYKHGFAQFKGLALIAVFLTIGQTHPELKKITSQMPKIIEQKEEVKIDIDINKLIPKGDYYTYHGSMTDEPYWETATWMVFKEPIEISSEDLANMRKLKGIIRGSSGRIIAGKCKGRIIPHGDTIVMNHRPPQPLWERKVAKCIRK